MERILSYAQAIHEATEQEMERDPSVIVMGIGVDDFKGTYGTTLGLKEKFGAARVFDTPLSEEGMTGIAVGAALGGLRPIHVHIRMDFLMLAMNQIVNLAAKMRYMYGGTVSVPLVIRAIIGKSWGQGAQHSQAFQSFFMHVPGLRVVAPSTPYDAKGCLIQSIRDDNPVMFIEHRTLHFEKGPVPEASYTVPFGRAKILAPGKDITLVGISWMAVECMRARNLLQKNGIEAEVIDPVSLSPLDMETILESARRTHYLLVVDTGWTSCGTSAEILARVAESPVAPEIRKMRRLGFEPVTCPTAKSLENLFYPDTGKIARTVCDMLEKKSPPRRSAPQKAGGPALFKGPF
jgi:acetoin:2,6-dichlorophenolindophenol oxidoreductase subunit beta